MTETRTPRKSPRTAWILAIPIAVIVSGFAGMIFYNYVNAPRRLYEQALVDLKEENLASVQRCVSSLIGVDEYEHQRAYLEAEILSRQDRLDEADKLLAVIPEDHEVSARAIVLRGKIKLGRGNIDEARSLFEAAFDRDGSLEEARRMLAIANDADSPLQRLNRGANALARADQEAVERELAALRASTEGVAHYHYLSAMALMAGKQYPGALNELGQCVNHPQLRSKALVMTGEALYHMGRFQEAETVWNRAALENDREIEAHRWLAVWYYDQGAVHFASNHLGQWADLDPNDYRPLRLLGLISKDYEQYDQAVSIYQRALQRNPPDLLRQEILVELADCQLELRDFAAARESLNDAVFEKTEFAKLSDTRQALLAESHYSEGELPRASAMLDSLLSENPDHVEGLRLRADIQLAESYYAGAVADLTRAVELAPNDYQTQFKLARAHGLNGDPEQQKAAADRAARLKSLLERISELNERAATEPANHEVRYQIGMASLEMGDPQLAQVWFRACLSLNPEHEPSRAELAKIEASATE